VTDRPSLTPDAAIVLGIASTAMPFARSAEDQAERWLRVLRLHGEAGVALTALGVSEAPLEETAAQPGEHAEPVVGDTVTGVTDQATRIASDRGAEVTSTMDVLVAVMRVYGQDFDRVLKAHGTDRAEVLERLGLAA
jgi:hypothetical protein